MDMGGDPLSPTGGWYDPRSANVHTGAGAGAASAAPAAGFWQDDAVAAPSVCCVCELEATAGWSPTCSRCERLCHYGEACSATLSGGRTVCLKCAIDIATAGLPAVPAANKSAEAGAATPGTHANAWSSVGGTERTSTAGGGGEAAPTSHVPRGILKPSTAVFTQQPSRPARAGPGPGATSSFNISSVIAGAAAATAAAARKRKRQEPGWVPELLKVADPCNDKQCPRLSIETRIKCLRKLHALLVANDPARHDDESRDDEAPAAVACELRVFRTHVNPGGYIRQFNSLFKAVEAATAARETFDLDAYVEGKGRASVAGAGKRRRVDAEADVADGRDASAPVTSVTGAGSATTTPTTVMKTTTPSTAAQPSATTAAAATATAVVFALAAAPSAPPSSALTPSTPAVAASASSSSSFTPTPTLATPTLPPPDPELRFEDVESGCRVAVVDTPDKLETVIELHLSRGVAVAVDLEGANLGPTGALSTVQLCVEGSTDVFVCDVLSLGAAAFATHRSSLRQLLEDPTVAKLFWDVRTDAAALYHQFGVRLRGVIDLQVCHVAIDVASGATPKYLTGLGRVLGELTTRSVLQLAVAASHPSCTPPPCSQRLLLLFGLQPLAIIHCASHATALLVSADHRRAYLFLSLEHFC
jgi:hypothetical protein